MNINLLTWFSERQLDFCPKHFVQANTPISEEKHLWILQNLQGRYYIGYNTNDNDNEFLFLLDDTYPFFEDPQEAVLYELTWS